MKVLSYESEDVQQPRRKVAPNLQVLFYFESETTTFTEVGTGSRSECENPMPG